MLSAIGLEKSYRTLIEKIICRRESPKYAYYIDEKIVKGQKMLSSFYMNDYLHPNDPNDMDDDREDDTEETEIKFKQWTMTD